MANELPTPEQPKVVAQEGLTEGQTAPIEPAVEVNTDPVPTQVTPERAPAPTEAPVHEVRVATDQKILDPSDPLAVQIPDAGRGDASLPIHQLAAPRPEDVFSAGEKADKPAPKKPADK